MSARFLKAAALVSILALAGCNASLEEIAPKSEFQLSQKLTKLISEKGMAKTAPIMVRVFKEENVLEVWKQKPNGRYDMVVSYDMCKWSGKLGPKFKEGDRQAPEGFYTVGPGQMNPNSQFYLAFNTGYPNAYDRVNGRTGAHLMVHGSCSSSGCYSMTDGQMQEIYAFARDAFAGGQTAFQFQAFPFRMTAANMARYKGDPNFGFWSMLKEGYDHFEITKVPPKVDVCEKRYVFNRFATPAEDGTTPELKFSAAGACPPAAPLPATLASAYQSYQTSYSTAFSSESSKSSLAPPKASILGTSESDLVAEWSRKRARGERVPLEPPTLKSDGTVHHATTRMGRIDSEIGRKQAAREAAEAEKKRVAEEKKLAAEQAKALAAAKRAEALAAKEAAKNPPPPPAPAPQETAKAEEPGRLKKILNLFSGG